MDPSLVGVEAPPSVLSREKVLEAVLNKLFLDPGWEDMRLSASLTHNVEKAFTSYPVHRMKQGQCYVSAMTPKIMFVQLTQFANGRRGFQLEGDERLRSRRQLMFPTACRNYASISDNNQRRR